ncbi:hypothetical protein D1AOALGA4SA_11446 [Olavius algarvensis Delta 1 endosymbiont]|nr:hypothetical protein D1AOALGA4SA_11446 [Olavius algarvensis Delta 1 endosymbiont]
MLNTKNIVFLLHQLDSTETRTRHLARRLAKLKEMQIVFR